MATTTTLSPRIYVACLASYTSGILHGAWIDADQDAEAIRSEIAAMLAHSPAPDAEEWAIHDHEGFGPISLGEYEAPEYLAVVAEMVRDFPAEAVAAFIDHYNGGPVHEMYRALQDAYGGTYHTPADFADEVLIGDEHRAAIGEELYGYLDLDWYARDQEINGGFSLIQTSDGVHVLWADY